MKWGNGCETGKILDLRGRFLLGEQKYETADFEMWLRMYGILILLPM